MKRLLMLFVTLIPLFANAQRVDKPGEPYEYYCHTVAKPQRVKTGRNAEICYKVTLFMCAESGCLLDKDGQEILFYDDENELYTYMSKRGWIFVSRREFDASIMSSTLFKKVVTSDEQVKEGLNIRIEKQWDSPVNNEQQY